MNLLEFLSIVFLGDTYFFLEELEEYFIKLEKEGVKVKNISVN